MVPVQIGTLNIRRDPALRAVGTLHTARTRFRNVKRLRGVLILWAHRLVYHSTLGSRVIKKKKVFKKKKKVFMGRTVRLAASGRIWHT